MNDSVYSQKEIKFNFLYLNIILKLKENKYT